MDWFQWLTWCRRQLAYVGPATRVLVLILGAALLAALIWAIPFVRRFSELFQQAGPTAQGFILFVILVVLLATAVYAIERAVRVEDLKGAKAQADTRREAAEAEAKQLQERWDRLLDVECRDVLWKRPCTIAAPAFAPRIDRKTRFLTVLNLKGGVGKTTLTGNLAACLAADHLRVLLIDIDFQGTLGSAAVDPELARLQHQNESLVNLLLATPAPDPKLIGKLAVSMNEVEKARVILANDSLDAAEFQLQARFFLDPQADPRFRFRAHLHRPEVLGHYDLVIFDCPPRVTTSVVNAVACSDYVLIPTKLDDGSIDAVPRTVAWIKSLGPVCQAEAIGVLASHVAVRVGKPVKADQQSYDRLAGEVESVCGAGALFAAVVPATNAAVPPGRGTVACTTDEGRKVYAAVVEELRRRMKI
jgi:cellulose biosynthesis protein BcsQ